MKAKYEIGPTPEQAEADRYAKDSLAFTESPDLAERIRDGINRHLWDRTVAERARKNGVW